MEREKIINISPVCKFGPGGDYTSNWPSEWPNPADNPKNMIYRLLNMIAGTIQTLRGGSAEYSISGPDEISVSPSANGETLLFADDLCRDKPAVHKTINRIRAYKQLARKRPCFSLSDQPTLFDSNLKNAKTA
ncbi:MAG: hypothetical protein JW749_09420 [Sedimentisphaerales bacterium]|nr:hypothetical protein [Sedimentisphaerales bacterium]